MTTATRNIRRTRLIYSVFLSLLVYSCQTWPSGSPGLTSSAQSENKNKAQPAVFTPAWKSILGPRDYLSHTQGFSGGVALHDRRPLLLTVGFDGILSFRQRYTGTLLWSTPLGAPGVGLPIFEKDIAYIPTDDGILSAYDIQKRKVIWKQQFSGLVSAPLTLYKKLIIVSDGTNSLYAIDRESGGYRWQKKGNPPKDFSYHGESRPLIVNHRLYMGFSDGTIACFDADSGRERWRKDLATEVNQFQDVDADPLISRGVLYAASAASGIYALKPEDGQQLWFYPQAGVITLSEFEGDLIVGLQSGEVGRFDPRERRFIWKVSFGTDGAPSRPLRFPHALMISLSRGGLYIIDPDTGALRDQFNPGNGILAPLTLSEDGWLYATSLSGHLYAFAPR